MEIKLSKGIVIVTVQLAEGVVTIYLSGINLVQPFGRVVFYGFRIINCCSNTAGTSSFLILLSISSVIRQNFIFVACRLTSFSFSFST
jgi:hypothetical protein